MSSLPREGCATPGYADNENFVIRSWLEALPHPSSSHNGDDVVFLNGDIDYAGIKNNLYDAPRSHRGRSPSRASEGQLRRRHPVATVSIRTPRHGSPSKRLRTENPGQEHLPSTTVSATSLAYRPTLASPRSQELGGGRAGPASTATTSTTTTTAASASRRSKSPARKVADLRFFSRPVRYYELADDIQLPAGIQPLVEAVATTAVEPALFPRAIQADINASFHRGKLPDSAFAPDDGSKDAQPQVC